MTCPNCENIVERADVPHIARACEGCGRTLRIHEPGRHGKGLQIKEGEQFVIPADWMRVSLNPLKSNARLFKYGLQWFAEQIHLEDLPNKKDDIAGELDRVQKRCDDILTKSPILAGLNLENDEHAENAIDILKRNRETCEWWAFLMGTYAAIVRDAVSAGDTLQAVWAMGCAERCRAMLVFKEHLEEVVWMGQSARRVVEILKRSERPSSSSVPTLVT